MWLLVILPGAVWNCNAYKYFPFCMCYYINRGLCLGLNEHIFVSAWALPVWRCTRQIQSSDLLWPNTSNETLVKNIIISFKNLPLAQFLACFCDVSHYLLMICLLLPVFSTDFCKTFPLLKFWHVHLMFLVICWWFVFSFQFILICVIFITFSYTGKYLVFFFYPLDLWVLDVRILFD